MGYSHPKSPPWFGVHGHNGTGNNGACSISSNSNSNSNAEVPTLRFTNGLRKVSFFNVNGAFVNLWNSHKIKSQNNLQLPNGVPTHMLYFSEQYGGTQKGVQVTNKLLQESFTQSGLSIDNGSTALNFMDFTEILKNCEHSLSEPIEISSNERSSHQWCPIKKSVPNNFAKFTGKHL